MKKYFNKVVLLLLMCMAGLVLIVAANRDQKLKLAGHEKTVVKLDTEAYQSVERTVSAEEADGRNALVLYTAGDEKSEKYLKNVRIVLKHMRFTATELPTDRTDSVSFGAYDLVIVATSQNEALETATERLLSYVRGGGRLFWGSVPESVETQFGAMYRGLGITEYSEFETSSGVSFVKELIPGIAGMTMTQDYSDASLRVVLEDDAEVYAYALSGEKKTPLVWYYPLGSGGVSVYNGTAIADDFWRGLIAGCISALYEENMYPIINAMCIFLDDFPSPQYDSENDIVRRTYNRTAREFYRDIWWPDMRSLAKKYGDAYTGLFVATYNDIVDPKHFTYTDDEMEWYFGNSLLRNGYEMGVHGYNHQSLTLVGGTPESFHYKPWGSTEDMTAAIRELLRIASYMFPQNVMRSYIPPSNYLSPEGRAAVVAAMPSLKVISGIYTNEGEEGDVYVQDFEIAADGVAEFPRVTSGMIPEEYVYMAYVNAMGVYGVFSHFLHPDDIFDEERGRGQTWNSMMDSYAELIDDVHSRYPFLRAMVSADAADALKVYSDVIPAILYEDDRITGSLEHFYGEAFFYLKTQKRPLSTDDSCEITAISPETEDVRYYLVTVREPNFTIKLVAQ